eukprot:COSAG02_NODE_4429_length_5371_cov_4.794196_5_plen_109_part_00
MTPCLSEIPSAFSKNGIAMTRRGILVDFVRLSSGQQQIALHVLSHVSLYTAIQYICSHRLKPNFEHFDAIGVDRHEVCQETTAAGADGGTTSAAVEPENAHEIGSRAE